MSWNHRILAHDTDGEIYLQIHEVYYDKEGVPDGYTMNAIAVSGEDLDSIKWTLDKMKECLEKPILWAGDKFPEEYKNNEIKS